MYVPYFKERNKKTLYDINRLNGMSMKQSAIQAGYSPSTANVAHNHIEPASQLRIKDALERKGVTNERLAAVIEDGLNAVDSEERPNHRIRYDFTKLALEAKGELKSGASVAIQINLPGDFLEPWGDEDV